MMRLLVSFSCCRRCRSQRKPLICVVPEAVGRFVAAEELPGSLLGLSACGLGFLGRSTSELRGDPLSVPAVAAAAAVVAESFLILV